MKLKKRVFLTTTLVLFIITFIGSFLFSIFLYHYTDNIFRKDALLLTKNISSNIINIYLNYYKESFPSFSRYILLIVSEIEDLVNFKIVDIHGKICFSLDEVLYKNKYDGEDRFVESNILEKVQGFKSSYIKIYKDRNLELIIIQPVFDFYQRHLYSIVYHFSLNSLIKKSFYLFLLSLLLFLFLLILNYFISVLFSSYLTKPLEIILTSIKKSREQEYNINIEIDHDDEFQILASELNKMMSEIRKERSLIIKTLFNLKTGILIIDKNDKITLCNQTFCNLLGLNRLPYEDEIYYQYYPELKKLEIYINKAREVKTNQNIDEFLFTSLPRTYFNIQILPLIFKERDSEEDEEKLIIIIDDITKNVEIQRRLVQLQKGELINSLASGLAHDFNNLIGSIKSTATLANTEILSKKVDIIFELKDYLDIILDTAESAEKIVKNLLSLARHREFSKSKVNLIETLDKVIRISKISIDKSVKIEFLNFTKEPCIIDADEILLEELFFNLIINASHSMTIMRSENEKWGGTITIEVFRIDSFSLSDIGENCYSINTDESIQSSIGKKFYRINFIDTGAGIKKENIRKIFQPFFSTKPDNIGTGLGLSMVLTLIQVHDGLLDLKSTLNHGSNFSVFLPFK
ncbi:MAG: ATP-binding protein [Exilispira sp.]